MYSIQHYVIKLVSDLLHVGGFLRVLRFLPRNNTDHHNITEILLKVALDTIKPTNQPKKEQIHAHTGLLIFFKSTSTSLFTGGTFY